MAKRGKTPSLISGKNPKLTVAKKLRHCCRCDKDLPKGSKCADVPVPGTLGDKTYCLDCLKETIEKSFSDLRELRSAVAEF